MSRSGNVWDNAAMESFFSLLKAEYIINISRFSRLLFDISCLLFEIFYRYGHTHVDMRFLGGRTGAKNWAACRNRCG
jgi:transposase InsO family protein